MGPSPLYAPQATRSGVEAIPRIHTLWLVQSTEDIEIALYNSQSALREALESDDPRMRMIAARLMLKTRQARERGWS
jgi:hypothetical protein